MTDIAQVSEEGFKKEVLESTIPVMVDFTAVWCQPCKMLEPIVKQLATEWGEQVKFLKMDVDESPNVVLDYQVMSVPTLILFKSGQPVERISGYSPKNHLQKKFAPHLS